MLFFIIMPCILGIRGINKISNTYIWCLVTSPGSHGHLHDDVMPWSALEAVKTLVMSSNNVSRVLDSGSHQCVRPSETNFIHFDLTNNT